MLETWARFAFTDRRTLRPRERQACRWLQHGVDATTQPDAPGVKEVGASAGWSKHTRRSADLNQIRGRAAGFPQAISSPVGIVSYDYISGRRRAAAMTAGASQHLTLSGGTLDCSATSTWGDRARSHHQPHRCHEARWEPRPRRHPARWASGAPPGTQPPAAQEGGAD